MNKIANLTTRQSPAEGTLNKGTACDLLGKLRSVLSSLETAVNESTSAGSLLQQQVSEWENLHQEAVQAVRNSISCESKFKRRMTAQAALTGLRFR